VSRCVNWTLAQSSCGCGKVSVVYIANRDCFRLQRMLVGLGAQAGLGGVPQTAQATSCHAGNSRPCGLTREMEAILSELQTPAEGAHADPGGAPLDLAAAETTQKQPGSSITRSYCSGDAVGQQWETTLRLLQQLQHHCEQSPKPASGGGCEPA
jgi:hypothetical protein